MKNLKIKFATLAIILGGTAAFATTANHNAGNQRWARNAQDGSYSNITGEVKGTDYSCTSSSEVCTAVYASGVDPNQPGHPAAISVEMGLFAQ